MKSLGLGSVEERNTCRGPISRAAVSVSNLTERQAEATESYQILAACGSCPFLHLSDNASQLYQSLP